MRRWAFPRAAFSISASDVRKYDVLCCNFRRAELFNSTCRVEQFDVSLFSTQLEMMGDAVWKLILIVCHEDQRLVGALTE